MATAVQHSGNNTPEPYSSERSGNTPQPYTSNMNRASQPQVSQPEPPSFQRSQSQSQVPQQQPAQKQEQPSQETTRQQQEQPAPEKTQPQATHSESQLENPQSEQGPPQPKHEEQESTKQDKGADAQPPTSAGREQPQEEEQGAARGEGKGEGNSGQTTEPDGGYPEQLHAGKLDGVGPEFAKQQHVTLGERFAGIKEQIKGTVKRDPDAKERGKERMTGELKKKKLEEDQQADPFGNAGDDKSEKKDEKGEGEGMEKADENDKDPKQQAQSGTTDAPTAHPTAKGAEEQAASVKPEGDNERSEPEKKAKETAEDAQVSSSS